MSLSYVIIVVPSYEETILPLREGDGVGLGLGWWWWELGFLIYHRTLETRLVNKR